MGRARVAPTLTLVVETLAEAPVPSLCEDWERPAALRELKALLAVAREANAAEIFHAMHHAGTAPRECAGCRLMRALARVSRSGEGTT